MDDPRLCEYCTAIDFTLIDHVSASGFDNLRSTGKRSQPDWSRRVGRSWTTCWAWSLGRQDRVDESSASCSFCRSICQLLDQNRHIRAFWQGKNAVLHEPVCLVGIDNAGQLGPPKGSSWQYTALRRLSLCWQQLSPENSRPGVVGNVTLHDIVPRLIECFQACTPRLSRQAIAEGVFTNTAGEPEALLFGGRLRPELVDPMLPAQWLSDCIANHGPDCGLSTGTRTGDSQMSLFRVVDVAAKTIKEISDVNLSSLQYAALSYVWGGPQKLLLQQSTLEEMKRPASLTPDKVPRTIWDAVLFAESLNVPYLWIDALCIIQDDGEDKSTQLGRMSDIYRHAVFTIAAGTGRSADAGLPGIRTPRTAVQTEVPLPSTHGGAYMSLLTTLTPRNDYYLPATDQCVWGTRAWTLQEHALSRRIIVFMDQQIFWHCACARWSEETHSETTLAKISWVGMQDISMLHTADRNTDLWRNFEILVRNFKMRNMSHSGDALDAFLGILAEIERRTGETFLWGMPTSNIEQCLCWMPYEPYPPPRRTCLTSRKMTSVHRQVPFPSWSWLGWGGHHQGIRYGEDKLKEAITCFILRNTPLRLDRVSPPAARENRTLLTLDDVVASDPELSLGGLSDVPDDQYLCFWAECLSFDSAETVDLENIQQVPPNVRFMKNSNGALAMSSLFQPDPDVDSEGEMGPSQEHILGPKPDAGSRVFVDVEGQEVVGEMMRCRWRNEEGRIELVLLAYKQERKEEFAVVLEIERQHGVGQRRSIGRVKRSAWEKSCPVRKVVVLN